jgi:hypothetical protein
MTVPASPVFEGFVVGPAARDASGGGGHSVGKLAQVRTPDVAIIYIIIKN